MGKVMNNTQFANIARDIATKYKTLYVMGCFGAPMNNINKTRYCNNHSYNKQSARTIKIKNASADTFGFDCVCLIKGILWGWSGNAGKTYGGATYTSNGVPDVGADGIMNYCTEVSTNFSNIQVGEVVHMSGHVGIYIGDGLAVECTPIWKDGVQITAVGNIGKKSGYNTRTWVNHGKLNFVEYSQNTPATPTPSQDSSNGYSGKFKVGDKVIINGNLYVSSTASSPSGSVSNKETEITRIAQNTAHPYNTKGDLGWMNESDIRLVSNSTSQPTEESVTYTVQRGDNLSGIARKYGTTWQDIYNKNKALIDGDAQRHGVRANYYNFIYTGQVLKIK